jgi:hypothetical protein
MHSLALGMPRPLSPKPMIIFCTIKYQLFDLRKELLPAAALGMAVARMLRQAMAS